MIQLKHSTPQTSVLPIHDVQVALLLSGMFLYSFSKQQFKYSIKDTKYNICPKAGCTQVAYSIKNMQHSMSVYTVYLYIYTYCRQSQSEDYQGPPNSQTKLFYSHLTRISKDAMKQQPEYKSHQK